MGQYYKAYVVDAEGMERKFCPQNAVYMTKMGYKSESDIIDRSWDRDDPNSWYNNFSGLKLMEHSWLKNDFVNGVLETIWDNPCRVAWVGDYADEPRDFHGHYTRDIYEGVWGEEGLKDLPFDEVPQIHKTGFLVNRTKGEYVDLDKYAEVSGFRPKWGNGSVWTIHPLPLLTVIGNGRGGGDYHGTDMGMVGAWAMDEIMFTEERPNELREVDYNLVRFAEN